MWLVACEGDTTLKTFKEPPVVSIDSPVGGAILDEGAAILMSGTVTDPKCAGSLTAVDVTWSVDGSKVCAGAVVELSGYTECTAVFAQGPATITLSAVNPDGETSSSTVEVEVERNSAPLAEIVSPNEGGEYFGNRLTLFEGLVSDGEDPADALSVVWTSSLDGVLPFSTAPASDGSSSGTAYLTPGEHQITLVVTDTTGRTGTDTSTAMVLVGSKPTVDLIAPASGDVVNIDAIVSFQAEIGDDEDPPEDIVAVWESDVDGVFSNQGASSDGMAEFTYDALAHGVHQITVTVTDSDGLTAVDMATLYVNAPPDAPSVHIDPDTPTSDESLFTVTDVGSYDADGDTITYSYAWYQNGVETAVTTNPLPSSATLRGDIWTVYVTPSDGISTGPAGTDTVSIGTAPPSLRSATITPATAYTDDTLSVAVAGWADADGDVEDYRYQWSLNGVALSGETASTLSALLFVKDDALSVAVTPWDGRESGATIVSSTRTITNSTPSTPVVVVVPSTPEREEDLTCSASSTDADGDSLTYSYSWTVNGAASGVTGVSVAASYTENGETWACEVTATDGTATSAVGSDSVLVDDYVNVRPEAPVVHISPDPPDTTDALTVVFDAASYDIDGDTLTYGYVWYREGAVSGETSNPLAASVTAKGEVWTVEVTPNDGYGDGASTTASVLILNSVPTLSSVTVSPATAYTDSTLTAVPAGWADADGDAVDYRYQWWVNGGAVSGATEVTLTGSNFVKGNSVYVVVTPWDGEDLGSSVTSATRMITNSAPSTPVVAVTPATPEREDDLTCTASSTDADGDSMVATYSWTVNGAASAVATSTVAEADTENGDTWACIVTVSDGTDTSAAGTASVVVADYLNVRPTAPVVHITPDPPTTTDPLAVVMDSVSYDLDGDTISYGYRWYRNGVYSGDTTNPLAASATTRGEVWTVEVTPNDGYGDGTAGSDSVTVGNSLPSITSAAITPTTAYTSDTLTATASGFADSDGDSASYRYQWLVNGSRVSGATNSTLSGSTFGRGDIIGVEITPWDGYDVGTAVASSTMTILNTTPTTPGVDLTPVYPETTDTLTCAVSSASTDADGDSITYTYSWTVNGSATGLSSTTVASSYTTNGEIWAWSVTASDGTATSSAGSDSAVVSDYTAPSAPVLTSPAPYRDATSVSILGTGEALSTITLYVSSSAGLTSSTTTSSAAATFGFTPSLSSGITYSFYATATDSYGNTSSVSNVVTTETCDPVDEYEDSSSYGDSCGDPIVDWSTLADSGSTTLSITGNILDSSDSDWYYVAASDAATSGINYYRMHVVMAAGSSEYAFAVYKDSCSSSALECTVSATSGYTEYQDFAQDVGDGSHGVPSETRACGTAVGNTCDDLSGDYYIQVYRTSAAYSCQEYELTVTNGAW